MRLLLAWTPFINLTGIRDPNAVALGHVVDSLSAVAALRDLGVARFIDLGSGGGVPGIPLAAALPANEALLVEPIGKKARFLETVVAATGLGDRVRVAATRAETLADDPARRDRWPAVLARAVAPLAELVELAFPLLERGGVLVAWKRGDLAAERTYADRAMRSLGGGDRREIQVEVPGLTGHRLVVLTRTGQVPPGYPRDPAVRRRRGP
jgi:16S rRNA (guanine527-N7)-methyltransferase